MELFVDSADVDKIEALAVRGMVDGVTTNPSLIAKTGRDFKEIISDIAKIVKGPISAEVSATDVDGIVNEGKVLSKIADNVFIKIPMTAEGLHACKLLTDAGHRVNVTLCFSAVQAMLAARAGAYFVSPFVGRLDDAGVDGMALIEEILQVYANYSFKTKVLVASIRSMNHVKASALIGADAATVPPDLLDKLISHPLTDKGLEIFLADWQKTKQSIL